MLAFTTDHIILVACGAMGALEKRKMLVCVDKDEHGVLGKMKDPSLLARLNSHLEHSSDPSSLLNKTEMFPILVDSGCLVSTSPDEADFEHLVDLKEPVTLEGTGSEVKVTQGGLACCKVLDEKGNVVVLKTFAYLNKHIGFRSLSPQSFFAKQKPEQELF